MRNIRKGKEKEPRDPDQRQCNSDQVTKKAPSWWHRTEQKDYTSTFGLEHAVLI